MVLRYGEVADDLTAHDGSEGDADHCDGWIKDWKVRGTIMEY